MPSPRPKKTDSEDVLYEYAVGALARRMRSVAELKRLLRPRVEAQQEAADERHADQDEKADADGEGDGHGFKLRAATQVSIN